MPFQIKELARTKTGDAKRILVTQQKVEFRSFEFIYAGRRKHGLTTFLGAASKAILSLKKKKRNGRRNGNRPVASTDDDFEFFSTCNWCQAMSN